MTREQKIKKIVFFTNFISINKRFNSKRQQEIIIPKIGKFFIGKKKKPINKATVKKRKPIKKPKIKPAQEINQYF